MWEVKGFTDQFLPDQLHRKVNQFIHVNARFVRKLLETSARWEPFWKILQERQRVDKEPARCQCFAEEGRDMVRNLEELIAAFFVDIVPIRNGENSGTS